MYALCLNIYKSYQDIKFSSLKITLAFMLGWNDVKQRYRRSKVGPFWLTISMAVMIATIGIVFGRLFNNPMSEFLHYLSFFINMWVFFYAFINDSCFAFIHEERVIKQISLPFTLYIFRVIWRNTIILFHNIVILPIVFVIVGKEININILYIFPGFILLVLNLTWVSILLSIICARFRDLPQIINSVMQILYFVTPIIWMPNSIQQKVDMSIVYFNPIYHLIEMVRAPLLGSHAPTTSYILISIIALLGWCVTMLTLGSAKRRIAYWL